jgi:DNA-binding IclR family transcriptional regulator
MQLRNIRRSATPLSQAVHDEAPADAANRRPRVNGIDRAFEILDFLLERGQPARCADIARGTGMPVSTSYQIVERLLGHQVLTGDVDGMIGLGPRLAQYGRGYRQTTPLLRVASEEMTRLAREVGESVQICGRADNDMVVLAMASGSGLFAVTSQVGTRVPINWTASGLLLTGHMPEAERLALYRQAAMPSPTGEAETDPEKLSQASARAFAEGLSVQVNGADFGVACVAAPVIDEAGRCVATISIVVPGIKARLPDLKRAVRNAAHAIETRIGWDRLPLEPGEAIA